VGAVSRRIKSEEDRLGQSLDAMATALERSASRIELRNLVALAFVRIEKLEAQVKSLQLEAPRGIPRG
jgi:hypothetical protein